MGKNKNRNKNGADEALDEAVTETTEENDTVSEDAVAEEETAQEVQATEEPETVEEAVAEPEAPIAPVAAPVVEHPRVTQAQPVGSLVDAGKNIPAQRTQALHDQLHVIHTELSKYVEHMAPSVPVNAETGAMYQKSLYRTLVATLKLPDEIFAQGWGIVLDIAHRHRSGAFDEARIYRFFEHLRPMGHQEVDGFRNLLHLIINTADPKGRAIALKQIDLQGLASRLHLGNSRAGERLVAYYSL